MSVRPAGVGHLGGEPVVAHFVPLYLPRTETFIYQVLMHHQRYRAIVLAHHRTSTAPLFPFPDVYTQSDLRRRASWQWIYQQTQAHLRGRRYVAYQSLLERHRARVLHVHFGHTSAEMIPLSKAAGIPHVTSFYGWDDTVALGEERRHRQFERLFRDGDLFLVEGSHIAARLAAKGCPRERIRVHRIGIDLEAIPFRPSDPPPSGDPVRLLFCGRLVEKKGLVYALRALAIVRKHGLAAELRVTGDGPLRPQIEEEIGALGLDGAVHLLGSTTYEVYLAELARCHFLVQPSVTAADGDTEGGAPTVLIEAQAAGKPVLTTFHADIPEIVRPGESAVLVRERDAEALGEELARLCREPGRWASMARAGRRHVETCHDIRRQVAALENLYDELRVTE